MLIMSKVTSVPRKNEVEPIDNNDLPEVDSINRKTLSNLYISDHEKKTGIFIVARKFKPSVYVVFVSIL